MYHVSNSGVERKFPMEGYDGKLVTAPLPQSFPQEAGIPGQNDGTLVRRWFFSKGYIGTNEWVITDINL
jgi:hypothetical protein